ncbi:MAG: hypothetical protein FK730_07530 [Asgard group archaeon]|nr:hypothetical protein [Asgard group archaeon]
MVEAKSIHYCKFCGEKIDFLKDFNDFYCSFCQSFQTTNQPPIRYIEQNEHLLLPDIDESMPPEEPPEFPKGWKRNLPIFRHREYVLKPIFSFREKHNFYNKQGQKLGEFKGKAFNFKGIYSVHDLEDNIVATIERRRIKFGKFSYDIKDHHSVQIGSIVITTRFFGRTFDIIDENNNTIGFSKEPKIFRPDYDIINKEGIEIITLDRKFWSGSMRIVILTNVNPLLVLSYGLILSVMIARDQAAAATATSAAV